MTMQSHLFFVLNDARPHSHHIRLQQQGSVVRRQSEHEKSKHSSHATKQKRKITAVPQMTT